ncbi:hypothetical protein OBBRIDRAFT_395395 [Obba rivulosa]|uniref:Uncharacterized protein n=1 Tax=Obba rivulosa TaxID=1052685 RepID=A0A8E2AZ10_9APHY|nr:hypothetical protein OBBRIDRAFT_395395 [Obba rivulosa]
MDLGFLPNGGTAAEDATLEPTRFKFKHQGSPLDVQIPSTRTQGYEGALSSDPHALQRQFVTTDSPSAASPTNPTHFHPQPLHQRARGIFGPRFTSPQREAALRLARKSQHQSGQNVAHTATSGTYSVLAMEEHTTSHTTSRIESETTAAGPGCRLQRSKSKTLHQRLDNG